nr:uncharacterized protein LOC112033698 [Quercus suber]
MKEMQNGSLKPYNPSEFLNTLEDILKKTGANLKWDASTCFSGLLTGFEESGKPIAKIFLSEIIQEYYCHYCRVSVKRPIEYEAIDLHDIEGHTVTEAVRQFRVGKIIDRDCTFCNPGGEMEQIDYFSKLPQILVFKLKKSVANDAQLENEIILRDPDRTRHFYTLYGVVLQQVDGNYSSYIHHGDGWVGFSDQNVSHLICDSLLSTDKYSLLYNLVIRFPGLINFHMKTIHACSFTRREIQRYGFLIVYLI